MATKYLVNRALASVRTMAVNLPDGTEVDATVSIFEVELVDETGQHGTITLRFMTPAERQAAAEKYKAGEYADIAV